MPAARLIFPELHYSRHALLWMVQTEIEIHQMQLGLNVWTCTNQNAVGWWFVVGRHVFYPSGTGSPWSKASCNIYSSSVGCLSGQV
jgi:hypothetical protein